jgi:TonB family protein
LAAADAIVAPQAVSRAEIAAATARPKLSPTSVLLPGARKLKPATAAKPAFPPGERLDGESLSVELEYRLDPSGAVADIATVNAPAGADAFIAAARAALAQWRYDPDAAAQLSGERLRHRFEFRDHGAGEEPAGCTMVTGSRLCVVNGGGPGEKDETVSRNRRCDSTTGTRLCRR